MSRPLLSISNVHTHYGPIAALKGVSLEIFAGEIVTIIGANGAGKTTTLMSVFNNPKISQGSICFNGNTIHQLEPHQIAKLGISISPEGRRLFPKMSVFENLLMGSICIQDKTIINQQLEFLYELFPILAQRRQQSAGTLSGGEQQMVAIARGLMAKPTLLLLDEPSLGLAPQMVHLIFHALHKISQQGTTLFLVEQNANQALKLADRAYVMVNGTITLSDTGNALLNNPEVQQAYLGGH